jgi:hypothetical protein
MQNVLIIKLSLAEEQHNVSKKKEANEEDK